MTRCSAVGTYMHLGPGRALCGALAWGPPARHPGRDVATGVWLWLRGLPCLGRCAAGTAGAGGLGSAAGGRLRLAGRFDEGDSGSGDYGKNNPNHHQYVP